MIHLHQSSSLASLAGTFQTVTDSQDSKNPLEPTWVIVQNNEIKEWLSLQVAKKKGISGNFQFIFPSEFLWNLYRLIDGDIPKQLPSDLNAMHWTLFELFLDEPDLLNKVPFAQKEQKNTMQLFYLSAQLADVFDQYQVYRPQMLLGWLDQNFVTGHKDERWQAYVWNRLNSYWQKHEEMQSIPSRAMAYQNLSQWLMEGKKSLYAKLPKDLYVFGLSQYSKPLIKILVLLGREIEVSLFRRKSQNAEKEGLSESILHKWSKPYHDQENLIQVLAKQAMTKVKFFDHPNSDTHKPQISINSCHSARREVQVLKDSILHYLSDKSGSKPEDILIMIPDESKYAPLLKAEFSGDADSDEINLPISQLYDRQHIEEHTLVQILELLGATFKPSSMLGLLNLTPIKNTFSFSDDELEILENWISESNAFRGIGDHFNTPYSWNKALNQMMAGFSMEADEMEIFKGLVPLQGIHSSDLMELAGRFSSFMNSIAHLYQEVQKNKKALEWVEFIEQVVHSFLEDDRGLNTTKDIYLVLSKLKEHIRFSKNNVEVPYTLIKNWLVTQLQDNSSTSGRFGQGITVSSYIPYRAVPFHFIAVLGMNEEEFPRKSIRPDFDLIYAHPQPGDRIQKEDDCFLFLETVQAAQDKLYISYLGQDQKTDVERMPSTLVQRLMEALPENRVNNTKHSLHAFNRKYYDKENKYQSFSIVHKQVADHIHNGEISNIQFIEDSFTQPDLQQLDKISINDFIDFFEEPSKYMVRNYLNIHDFNTQKEIRDRESFDMDGLQSYKLSNFIFEKLSEGYLKEQIYSYSETNGWIPDKLKGEKVFKSNFEAVQELRSAIREVSVDESRSEQINLTMNTLNLVGSISGIQGDIFISTRVGKRKAVNEIEHWIRHLILLNSGIEIERSIFISKDKGGISTMTILSSEIDMDVLNDYIDWFLEETPVFQKFAFFPETSKTYAEAFIKKMDHDYALSKARSEWEPSFNRTFVESNDYYNRLLWREKDPLTEEMYSKNALRFWRPFLRAVEASNDQ